jgi:tetratricopeptide (TPR) repeat protein
MDRILMLLPKVLVAVALAIALAGGPAVAALPESDSTGPSITAPVKTAPGKGDSPIFVDEKIGTGPDALAEMPLAEESDSSNKAEGKKALSLDAAKTQRIRSLALEQVAQQADRKTRHGIELAGRGAYFAARAEFVGALRLVAEGLDAEEKTGAHSQALAKAMTAMKEAEDFLPKGSRVDSALDLAGLAAVHSTPVLKDDSKKMTPLAALSRYMTFAQEQLAESAGHEVAGSMALHSLGKLHSTLAQKKSTPIAAPESKAMVFYQAALLVYPKNHLSANDLGVLLAQCGRWADARAVLEHSLALNPQSTGWRNLAIVYKQLGQNALAEQAAGQSLRLRQIELARRRQMSGPADDRVRWIDSQTFVQTSRDSASTAVANRTPPVAKPQASARQPAPTPAAAERMSRRSPGYER